VRHGRIDIDAVLTVLDAGASDSNLAEAARRLHLGSQQTSTTAELAGRARQLRLEMILHLVSLLDQRDFGWFLGRWVSESIAGGQTNASGEPP
jgi:hypothetical protein